MPILAATCILAPVAKAASMERLQETFRNLDTNADGLVSGIEFENKKIHIFGLRDANGDQILQRSEVDIDPDQFQVVDQDRDDQISGLEFVDAKIGQFETYDMDGDGSLTLDELATIAGSSVSSP